MTTPSQMIDTTVSPPKRTALRSNSIVTAIGLILLIGLLGGYTSLSNSLTSAIRSSFPEVKANIDGVSDGQIFTDGESVAFSAVGSTGKQLSYDWTFSDGSTYNTPEITRVFQYSQGSTDYSVTLKVFDPLGPSTQKHVDETTIRFKVYPNPPQNAKFIYQIQSFSGSYNVTFTPSFSGSASNIEQISWSYGDGYTNTDYYVEPVQHYYYGAGTYTVTMTIVDVVGQQATYSATITLN
jgi:PKD domain